MNQVCEQTGRYYISSRPQVASESGGVQLELPLMPDEPDHTPTHPGPVQNGNTDIDSIQLRGAAQAIRGLEEKKLPLHGEPHLERVVETQTK